MEQHPENVTSTVASPSVMLRWVTGVGVIGAGLLALGSFALSFVALSQFAVGIGLAADLAFVYPLIIDGFIVMATVAAVVMRQQQRRQRAYVWSLLVLFGGISICGNALHALNASSRVYDIWLAASGSAVPPIALLLASHLLVMMIERQTTPNPVVAHSVVAPVATTPAVASLRDDTAPAPVMAPQIGVERRVATPKPPTPTTATSDVRAWIADRETAGLAASPAEYADELGISLRTAQRRFSALTAATSNVTSIGDRRRERHE